MYNYCLSKKLAAKIRLYGQFAPVEIAKKNMHKLKICSDYACFYRMRNSENINYSEQ
jgi:hypothetical protein